MLDPEYISHMAEGSEDISEQLHQDILDAMVGRLMARLAKGENYLTSTDRWQLQVLSDAGYLLEDIQAEIAARTKQQMEEMRRIFEDAAVESYAWDMAVYQAAGLSPAPLAKSPQLIRLLQRDYAKTAGEWRNFTGTLANAAQQTFIRQCDEAYHLVTSGAMGYPQAVRRAIETIASDGVTVQYTRRDEHGQLEVYHTDTIETATLRAVRTGARQACDAITDARMDELDWDIVLASAHLGARTGDGGENHTNHYWWQGKFYSRSGKNKRFPAWAVVGEGDVQGFGGPNCRHSKGPGDGVHNPFEHFDSEENRKKEQLDQRQRLLERRIRKTRREVMTLQEAIDKAPDEATRAELAAAHRKKAVLLQRQEEAYDAFCKENDLRKLYDRLEVARYGPKQAKAAEEAAGVAAKKAAERNRAADEEQFARYREVLGEEAPKDLATFQQMKYNKPAEWEDLKGFYRYKKSYPTGNHRCYAAQQELAAEGIRKGVIVPPEPVRAYILPLRKGPGRRGHDPWHITKRMQERHVTDDALREYMDNAMVMFIQWGGIRRRYVSNEGMCAIAYRKEAEDWLFRSGWTKYDYDAESERIMEVITKHGL